MLVKINDLSYSIGEKQLFDHLTFVFEKKTYAIVGINGTGKSTLLNMIANHDPSMTYQKDIRIGYLSQYHHFNPQHTLLQEAQNLLKDVNEYEIKTSLSKFGLNDYHQKIEILSGGQLKRFALAIVLLKECDLLLLDEPTNHLDTNMIEYLENILKKRNQATIMVTHDRYFLERITNQIIELDRGKLYSYEGNYHYYLEEKERRLEEMKLQDHKRHQFLKKELEWVRRGVQARATKSKDRLKRFEDLSKQKDFVDNGQIDLIFNNVRIGTKTIELKNLSKSYDSLLFKPFNYEFKRYDRIGILGVNGSGKTTLMNCIADITSYDGEIIKGETIKIGYYKQGLHDLKENMRVIDFVKETSDAFHFQSQVLSARNLCERFLFDENLQYTYISQLSGGEKRRLYLLKVLMEQCNVLLLDEPTNDLDIDTITLLENYLDTFPGIVICVSHDRYFLDKVCDGIFVLKDQTITYHNGGYSDQIQIETKVKKEKTNNKPKREKIRKLTYLEKQELTSLTTSIPELEEALNKINHLFDTTTDFDTLSQYQVQRDELENQLDEMNMRYLELLEIEENSQS